MTEKLYYIDSYISEFSAKVISVTEVDGAYEVVLDKTAFFPEEGGQSSDRGYIGESYVSYVYEKDGIIYHRVDTPPVGTDAYCKIDFAERFDKMQQHTAEHILSGVIHALYGYNNVGFHLGEDIVTFDIDHPLTREQLDEVENLANRAVFDNIKIETSFPAPDELEKTFYRSKLDLTENVRIVKIGEVDSCACCAPHVAYTGEVGIIKILDFMRYKGGIRLHARCGLAALADYNQKYRSGYAISTKLSVKQNEIFSATERLLDTISEYKDKLYRVKCELRQIKLQGLEYTDKNICIFEDEADMNAIRAYVNEAVKKCGGMCGVFAGNDESGYKYIVASEHIDLKPMSIKMKNELSCRGGGSSIMIQGSSSSTKEEIQNFFENN